MPSLKSKRAVVSNAPQTIPVLDLTGGADLRRSQTLLDPSRGRTYLNQSLEEPGALIMRPGYVQASSAAIFSGAPQGGGRIYLKNAVFSLVAGGGAIHKPADDWSDTGAVYSTISSTNQVFFPFDRDLVMVMDGANRPRFSTNGTNWRLSGIDAPSSAAVASTVTGGALSSGEYAFAYAYKYRGTADESNGSPESTITLTASTGAIHLAASPSTDPKVDAFVWYARHKTPDLESVLRKFSSGAASTVTATSSNWTANAEISTNHNAPVAGLRFAVSWKSRWWAPSGTIGNRLYFTELFLPQAWPSLFFIDIPFEKGDSITALQPLGDTLIVHGQSGAFLIIGQTALDFEVKPHAGAEAGAYGQRAVTKVEQASMHASVKGMHSFDGASDRNLTFDIQKAIDDLVSNVASTELAKTAVVYDDLQKEARMSAARIYPTATRGEWILNLNRTRDQEGVPAWTTTDRDIAFYMMWDGNEGVAGNRGRLFTMPSTTGLVYEENVGASANSSNMTASYEGPGISMGLHQSRFVGVHVEVEPHGGALSIEPVVDGISQGTIPMSIGTGLYTYGSTLATYGTATYGSAARLKLYTPFPLSASGRALVLKYTYVGNERMKVFSYTPVVVPEPEPRTMGA
jgi:hypothetical protein